MNQQVFEKQNDLESKAKRRLQEVLDSSKEEDEEDSEYDDEDLLSSDQENEE